MTYRYKLRGAGSGGDSDGGEQTCQSGEATLGQDVNDLKMIKRVQESFFAIDRNALARVKPGCGFERQANTLYHLPLRSASYTAKLSLIAASSASQPRQPEIVLRIPSSAKWLQTRRVISARIRRLSTIQMRAE